MNAVLTKYAPWMHGILRIVTALVFMEHGTQKLFHFPPMERFGGGAGARGAARAVQGAVDTAASAVSSMADSAMSAVSSMASVVDPGGATPPTPVPGREGMPPTMQALFMVAGILETFGGLGLVLGVFTRPIAFVVAGECAVIFWWMDVGRSGSIFPASNGGEVAVLFCFNFLFLLFAGPGAFALDNVLGRRKTA